MRILASECRQMSFGGVAAYLRENADSAMKFTARITSPSPSWTGQRSSKPLVAGSSPAGDTSF